LNPKKSIFGVTEGKLLGHVISKEGISIDPERVNFISQLIYPHNKKGMQSFFGEINFVQKSITNFAETMRPLQRMIKKGIDFKWSCVDKMAFKKIKITITNAPKRFVH